jgi:hypothetical protein
MTKDTKPHMQKDLYRGEALLFATMNNEILMNFTGLRLTRI